MPSPWVEIFRAVAEILWDNRGEILSAVDKLNREMGPHKGTMFCQDCGSEGKQVTVLVDGRETFRADCPKHGTVRAKDKKP